MTNLNFKAKGRELPRDKVSVVKIILKDEYLTRQRFFRYAHLFLLLNVNGELLIHCENKQSKIKVMLKKCLLITLKFNFSKGRRCTPCTQPKFACLIET
jgi:hypothetical protein